MSRPFVASFFALFAVVIIAAAVRVPALDIPYYQDENDWAAIVAEGSELAGRIPHPPLSEAIYVATDRVFGNENLRMTPFLLSLVNIVLLYALVRYRFSARAALFSAALFALSYFSVLASLVVDTDGQVLPFFFLVAALAYYRWQDATTSNRKLAWAGVFLGALTLGLLTKLGFVVTIGAFVLDFLYARRKSLDMWSLAWYGAWLVTFIAGIVLLILVSQTLFPAFNLSTSMRYWSHFVVFDRNFFQVIIQTAKSAMFLSPLLIALPFFLSRELRDKSMLFISFIVSGLLFYLVVFDFSGAALDRYLQFLIIPLAAMGGVALAHVYASRIRMRNLVLLATAFVGLILIQFVPHAVPALHPKAAWLSLIGKFEWNFLFPFTGGSGPMGFYVSFLMIALAFCLSAAMIAAYLSRRASVGMAVSILLGAGIAYNATFIEEYVVGAINGRTGYVLEEALQFIGETPDVEKVITYNDYGAYQLQGMGKYQRRLYVDPAYIESYKPILEEFKGHYLVVDVPRIDPDSMYPAFFASCELAYESRSGKVGATVYDCREAP